MANIIETIFTITAGQGSTYFTSSGAVSLDRIYLGTSAGVSLYLGNSGTATMNSAGKEVLYPKTNVSPFKADILAYGGGATQGKNLKISFDNTVVVDQDINTTNVFQDEEHEHFNLTNTAIINSTQNSSIVFTLTATNNGLFQIFTIEKTYIKLYFQQWDLIAQKIGDGAGLITCPGRVYDGESVDFYCNVGAYCTFHGWYSDIEHTNLVSSSIRYTVTASEDLTLYAYITKDIDIYDDLYIKSFFANTNKWIVPYHYYIKTQNGWEQQDTKNTINKNLSYHHITESANEYIDSIETSWIVNYNPYARLVFYIKNPNNYIMLNWSGATNYYCCPFDEGFGIFFDGTYYSGSQHVSYTYITDIENTPITKTLTLTLTVTTHKIYFIDKDGNSFTETFQNNQPYTVTTPDGYTNFIGWKEIYQGEPTGRILTVGNSYYDIGTNNTIYYEPVFNE